MADTLQGFIDRLWAVADKRNHAFENPITIMINVGQNDLFYVVVAYHEPNHVTLPLNVTWIVTDPNNPSFGKALRRASALPFNGFRNTWAELRTYSDFTDEPQFWDLSSTFQLGEVEVSGIREASPTLRGLFNLNRIAPDPLDPQVASDSDPRMTNARAPLPHAHPLLPTTMLAGSTGINQFYVTISDAESPAIGEVLVLTEQGDGPNEWLGLWRKPVAADIAYDGFTFDELIINGTIDDTVEEGMSIPFTADALFSDASTRLGVPAQWEIIAGMGAGTISTSTGMFTSNDVLADTLVRIRATWTHADSYQQRSSTYDLTVIDTTIIAELIDLRIDGAITLDEGGNTIAYTVTALYASGESQGINPVTFTSSNPAAGSLDAVTGIFTSTSDATNNQTTTLTATYSENGATKSVSVDLVVRDLTVYPMSAEIVGQSTVNEDTEATYTLVVTFSDLTTQTVVVSDWAISAGAAGVIDSSTGVLSAPTNVDQNVLAIISASYTANGRTANAEKNITVSDDTIYPLSATILASASQIAEGSTLTLQLEVSFSNQTTSTVPVTDWASTIAEAGVIIATTGEFTASADVAQNTETVISASFTQAGETVSAIYDLTVLDQTNYPVSANIVGNSAMNEGDVQALILRVTYQDSTTKDVAATWSDSGQGNATITPSGVVTAKSNVNSNVIETITATYTEDGVPFTETLEITIADATVYPVSAVITGPTTVNENTTVAYALSVTFDDGTTSVQAVNTFALDVSGAGTITSNGSLTAPSNVSSNVAAEVSASFTLDGREVNAALGITVTDSTVYPASARIIGPISVEEETAATYMFEVTWTDASITARAVTDWASSNTAAATINTNTGVLTALSNSGDAVTVLSASFTSEGVKVSDTHQVTVLDATNYPVGATILGVNTIVEGGETTYTLEVTFTDGTVQVMPVTDWTLSDPVAGVINATTGVFLADGQLTANITATISASFSAFGAEVSDTHTVTVTDETVYPVNAEVLGPNSVDEGNTASYSLRVTFDDTSVQTVEATDWTSTVPAAGTIDVATGEFVAASNDTRTNIVSEISATWDVDGTSVTGTKTIGVVDTTPYLSSVAISGAADINESSSESYSLTATYTDGSTATVQSDLWEITQGTEATIDSATGVLTSTGDFVGNTTVTLRATYAELGIAEVDTLQVNVLDTVLRPASAVIVGPSEVSESSTAQYSITVTYDNGTTATVTSAQWASSATDAGSIGTTGLFTAAAVLSDTPTTISVDYTENGIEVSDSFLVNVRGEAPATAGMPRWGYGGHAGPTLTDNGYTGPQDFIDGMVTEYLAPVSGELIVYDQADGNTWTYMAFPKALGTAIFTDEGNGFPGAWEGASWEEDLSNYTTSEGPIEVTYDDGTGPAPWYVYRSDWPGPTYSPVTFRVDYSNA